MAVNDVERRAKQAGYMRAYRIRNRERLLERDRTYRTEHRVELAAKMRAWRSKNRERDAGNRQRRYAADPKRHVSYTLKWNRANPDKVRANYDRRNARRRLEDYRARVRRESRLPGRKERINAYTYKWRERHPEAFAAISARRYARKRGADGSHTAEQWEEKKRLFAYCCAYCGEAKPLSRDHKIPLSRGGSNDIMNILPACRSCNSRKNDATVQEFLARSA